jgi:hypothetical protein
MALRQTAMRLISVETDDEAHAVALSTVVSAATRHGEVRRHLFFRLGVTRSSEALSSP